MPAIEDNATSMSLAEAWRAAVCELAPDAAPHTDANPQTPLEWAAASDIDAKTQCQAAARAFGIPFLDDLTPHPPSALFVERIPIDFARQHELIGLAMADDRLGLAMATLQSWGQADLVSRYLNRPIEPIFALVEQVRAAINSGYQQREGQAQALIDTLDQEEVLAEVAQLEGREDLLDVSGRAGHQTREPDAL